MKDKKIIVLAAVILLLLVVLSLAKSKEPKPVDWSHNFINTKTSPYGTYIAYELLNDLFDKSKIRSTRQSIFSNLKESIDVYSYGVEDDYYSGYDSDSLDSLQSETNGNIDITNEPDLYTDTDSLAQVGSYLFINESFNVEDDELDYLLAYVGMGNNAFVTAEHFSSKLMTTLGVDVVKYHKGLDTTYVLVDYPDRVYRIGNMYSQVTLNADSCFLPNRVLARNGNDEIVFLDISYGSGHIYLHTVPRAFTNYTLLNTFKYDFAFRCLSYLPSNSTIIWDESQKQGIIGEYSLFRVMLNHKALRIALYMILIGLLLFMIFGAKRTQRIIPVIQPPINSSLEFLATISNLYYRKKDFNAIIQKRHAYFLDFIRKNYYTTTEVQDEEFYRLVSSKSGVELGKIQELFALYNDACSTSRLSNELFLRYNGLLEDIYRKQQNKN